MRSYLRLYSKLTVYFNRYDLIDNNLIRNHILCYNIVMINFKPFISVGKIMHFQIVILKVIIGAINCY